MRIRSKADIAKGLNHLATFHPQLADAAGECGEIPLRLLEPGFAGLASIIISQQVSRASAQAILSRLTSMICPLTSRTFLDAGEQSWRAAGLSRPKQRSLKALAEGIVSGHLDLVQIGAIGPELAIARLTSVHGIGPWTAEVYLMFCEGHPDLFPAGDLALREAVRMLNSLDTRPDEKACRKIAASWSPYRSVAARLLWAYYAAKGRDAVPI